MVENNLRIIKGHIKGGGTLLVEIPIQPHEIYLVPNSQGVMEPRAWRDGRVYVPGLEESNTQALREATTNWFLHRERFDMHNGPRVNSEESNRFTRPVVEGVENDLVWVSNTNVNPNGGKNG